MAHPIPRSQTQTQAGKGAEFITVFAILWDAIVAVLLVSQADIPIWFKTIFIGVGLFITWAAWQAWRQRLAGGRIQLHLSRDPVPHGIATAVNFELQKPLHAQNWQLEAKIEAKSHSQSNFGMVWRQDFAAYCLDGKQVRAEFSLPADMPATSASDSETSYQITLTLKAADLSWTFNLQTRIASAGEATFDVQDARSIGSNVPTYSPEQIAKARRPWLAFVIIFWAIVLATQFTSFWDFNLWSIAKAQVGAGAYSTSQDTEEFEVRVTNLLMSDWALRARLIGQARVVNGELKVRVQSLTIQPMGSCDAKSSICNIESVRLLLAKDGEKSFSTAAQSQDIAVEANLRETKRWAMPLSEMGTEISMRLPAVVDVQTMRLKLDVRSASKSSVYPSHGPYLALHRALAKTSQHKDPCEQLVAKRELVRAGCTVQLEQALMRSGGFVQSASEQFSSLWQSVRGVAVKVGIGTATDAPVDSLDNLLLDALRSENFATASTLLTAGANPNAQDPEEKGRSALGYAAAANDVGMVERLLQAGADPDARATNSLGQIVTPLTQALRTDAAQAIARLLQAGAKTQTQDAKGWTPMHIAAYESAHQSLQVLVRAGADVNERTPAYRQQSVLQTAIQFGDMQTMRALLQLGADPQIKDNQAENACGWARFFKRNAQIQALFCTPDVGVHSPSIVSK